MQRKMPSEPPAMWFNAVLIGRGLQYEQRKPIIKQYAMDWRMANTPQLAA